ncbi:MAG: DUF1858 domain-containing protein [Minisyncoccia bacterium]
MKKIDKNTKLKDILEIEGAEEVLIKYNIPCLYCPLAKFEIENLKIGDICKFYGIDIKNLIKDLKKLLEDKK